jgi:hypothetical protein
MTIKPQRQLPLIILEILYSDFSKPFSQKVYARLPLNRVKEKMGWFLVHILRSSTYHQCRCHQCLCQGTAIRSQEWGAEYGTYLTAAE